jgi:HEAT repeat protein
VRLLRAAAVLGRLGTPEAVEALRDLAADPRFREVLDGASPHGREAKAARAAVDALGPAPRP